MGEAISSANAPQQDARGRIFEKGNRFPGKRVGTSKPETEDIVLPISTQLDELRAEQPEDQPEAQPDEQPDEEQPEFQSEFQSDEQPDEE